MRALTVHQPWAQLIVLGVKSIETRGWATKYRGPLVIHAGKRSEPFADPWVALINASTQLDSLPLAPLGAIVGTCNLVDVVPIVHGNSPWDKRLPPICLVHVNDKLWHHVGPSAADMTDQLPYGDFTPGRRAWLLEDAKPTTERCPGCWGKSVCGRHYQIAVSNEQCADCAGRVECDVCRDRGTCDPIPAKGKQGLWTWNP